MPWELDREGSYLVMKFFVEGLLNMSFQQEATPYCEKQVKEVGILRCDLRCRL